MAGKQKIGANLARPRAALLASAVQHLQAGRLDEARKAYRALLAADARHVIALHHLGIVEHQLGQSEEAIRLLRRALELKPANAQAHSDLAVILMQLGRDGEAAEACNKAVMLDAGFAAAHANLGDLMRRRGDHVAAERCYARAIELQPGFAPAHIGRAESLVALDRLDDAMAASEAAIRLVPAHAEGHAAKGLVLDRMGRFEEAITAYQQALRLDPKLAVIHLRLASTYQAQGRLDEALAATARALESDPQYAEAYHSRARILQRLGRIGEAFAAYERALKAKPAFAEAFASLGLLQHQTGRGDDAVETLMRAIDLAPENGSVYVKLANVLKEQKRYVEALEIYRAMLNLPGAPPPAGLYDYCSLRRQICDWNGLDEAERRAIDAVIASREPVPPFPSLAMHCTPEDHLSLARLWASAFMENSAPAAPRLASGARSGDGRIRLGYLSSDFFEHATASLIAELIERHDRARFEVIAYCSSPEDGSALRRRLMTAFDRFVTIREHSHRDAAALIARDGIDILIDLKGYTRDARSMIPARRPAPIQVNYLGYPSTMGAPFIDYIIADPFIAPMERQRYFDEKIVHLPDCYQPNDRHRRCSAVALSRADCGLTEDAFVFCSFNDVYKITAPVFSVWMRLLSQVPRSVLWLLDANPLAQANLRKEAAARGIDPERLIFAPKLRMAEHLARYALADLFLDNLPVNAHTTASEALWSGLPVITCAGDVFVGRVAGSLLNACGLPELVTSSLQDYEALALRLATDRAALAAIRGRLGKNRFSAPLFDIERYTLNLEAAFAHMVRLYRSGLSPQAFAIADLGEN